LRAKAARPCPARKFETYPKSVESGVSPILGFGGRSARGPKSGYLRIVPARRCLWLSIAKKPTGRSRAEKLEAWLISGQ